MAYDSLISRRQVLGGIAAASTLPFGNLLAATANKPMRGALMILSTPYTEAGDVDFDDQTTENKFIEKYFIIAHRAVINSIQIVEEKNIKSDRFIITASNDCNINIHRLSNGVFIGQFG